MTPRVVYRRPPAIVVVKHTHHGDDGSEARAVAAMTNHAGRLYALAIGLVVFFLAWAVVAARPWAATTANPQQQALVVRQAQLQREAKLVSQIVAQRAQLARVTRNRQLASAAAAPVAPVAAVRVVNLPPLTITRTS